MSSNEIVDCAVPMGLVILGCTEQCNGCIHLRSCWLQWWSTQLKFDLQGSDCRSRCHSCVKVAWCRGCVRNAIVFCSWTSQIVLEWLHQGCDSDLSADFLNFGAGDFPSKFSLQNCSKIFFFCFGAEIRFWSCNFCVKAPLCKSFSITVRKLLCVQAFLCKNFLCVKASVCKSFCLKASVCKRFSV